MQNKVTAIIQVRVGSTRLPGKVLKEINGVPLIKTLFERLRRSNYIDDIIIATTEKEEDIKLIDLFNNMNVIVKRGPVEDVLSRYFLVSQEINSDAIVRITGDCPLIDPEIVDSVIQLFYSDNYDYVSNCNPPTYPDGLDVEVFKKEILDMAHKNCSCPKKREHVTPWIKENKNLKIGNLENPIDFSKLRLTIDEPEDLIVIENIMSHFHYSNTFNFNEIIDLYQKQPSLFNANQNFQRNEGATLSTGQKLWRRAKKVIPGGGMLLSKRPELYLPNGWPAYFSKSKGCYVWDLEGNKYIDMSLMGVGTNILGYGNSYVDNEVRKVVEKGNMSTLNCPEEVLLAEKLVDLHPWSEMVKFARTGGEANSIAVRIARAFTGKEKIAICGYHGWHDWYLASNLKSSDQLDKHLLPGLEPKGVPFCLKDTVIPFTYNNLEEFEKVVEKNNLAAVKMEVERTFPPSEGYLQKIREICTKNGIVLIFDECTSGFRETFGGLHLKYNVNPDMAIFGKALGNGYAITAVLGKSEIMQNAQSTFISSTFWTERIGPSAALKTLEIMEKEKSWEIITSKGRLLKSKIKKIAEEYNFDISFSGINSLLSFKFNNEHPNLYKTLITQEMLKKGFLASNTTYLCTSHTENILNNYCIALDEVFSLLSTCDSYKEVQGLLNNPICHSGFKRLN